ncbi:MAG: cation transporter [Bacteroidota bacterium]
MKTMIITMAMFFGIAIISPNAANAQCCGGKEKASCHKSTPSNSQNRTAGAVKDSLKVSGKCGMCKTRIETAALTVKGIKDAQWNETTGMLVYSYDGSVKKEDVSTAVGKAGHDTELGKAPDKAYNKLPGCCKYR